MADEDTPPPSSSKKKIGAAIGVGVVVLVIVIVAVSGKKEETGEKHEEEVSQKPVQIQETATTVITSTNPSIEKVRAREVGGKDVFLYTMKNKVGMEVEVSSLGARLVQMRLDSANYLLDRGNALDAVGVWQGPACGRNPDMYQEHFEQELSLDGRLVLYTESEVLRIEVVYDLTETNNLTVTITGIRKGSADRVLMDICSNDLVNINTVGNITTHELQIPASHFDSGGGWEILGPGLRNIVNLTKISKVVQNALSLNGGSRFAVDVYKLPGTGATKHAATVVNQDKRLTIYTNQECIEFYIDFSNITYVRLSTRNYPYPSTESSDTRITLGETPYQFIISYTLE